MEKRTVRWYVSLCAAAAIAFSAIPTASADDATAPQWDGATGDTGCSFNWSIEYEWIDEIVPFVLEAGDQSYTLRVRLTPPDLERSRVLVLEYNCEPLTEIVFQCMTAQTATELLECAGIRYVR
jgi:hypothetical protein